jgi:hypothetical protein
MGVDSDRNTEMEEEIKKGEGVEERRDQQFTTVHISPAIGAHKGFIYDPSGVNTSIEQEAQNIKIATLRGEHKWHFFILQRK